MRCLEGPLIAGGLCGLSVSGEVLEEHLPDGVVKLVFPPAGQQLLAIEKGEGANGKLWRGELSECIVELALGLWLRGPVAALAVAHLSAATSCS